MDKLPSKKPKKIGLALSGGGWRGLAHVGVLKVLEENNIPIDYIAGASAGALMGGLYCYFGNSTDLEKFILDFGYKDLFKIISDPKMKSGLLKGRKITDYLKQATNNSDIENLKIPFCAVASDIISGESYYMSKGNLAEAIKTSGSIPLVFQPSKIDGKVLIDGGATENVPVKCVKEMGADFVIAVSVNTAYFPVKEEDVNSSTKIAVVSTRTMLKKLSEILASEADIVIEPKISKKKVGVGVSYFLEFVREKDIIKVGEKATAESIQEIKRKIKV
ncbi:patatin-like phospholipase family protein [Patescibacteria group bacterium]|nr:patatin-like phospholipase family protein [Patescibacteria group bacterium]